MTLRCRTVMILIKRILDLSIIFTLSFVNAAKSQSVKIGSIKTGNYDDMVNLAYDSISNEISGFISAKQYDYSEKVIKFSCYVLFKGKYNKTDKCSINLDEPNNFKSISRGNLTLGKDHLSLHTDSPISFLPDLFGP